MGQPSHLKSLQALELAARTGSFAAAAELLAITPAAVGQRVKALEDYLGVELIVRGRAGIRPTEALLRALPELAAAFAGIEAASDLLDMQRPQELHIAAPPDFADLWLAPRLASFRASHPQIRLCINGLGDVPMRLGHADCEILFGAAPADGQCDLLFHDFVLPVASPVNVERTRTLPPAERLEGFPLLHLDFYKDDPARLSWPCWFERNGIERTAPERGMHFQRISGALDAVLAHAGIVLCGAALLGKALEDGRLGTPYPAATGCRSDHAFIARFRPRHTTAPTAERFRAWLGEQAESTRRWLVAFVGEVG
ncbi:MAG: LysR family transcriptional regulator [Sphingobium sp.]|nr:LysR family transcriptional regulator [Sphingobium sp.]